MSLSPLFFIRPYLYFFLLLLFFYMLPSEDVSSILAFVNLVQRPFQVAEMLQVYPPPPVTGMLRSSLYLFLFFCLSVDLESPRRFLKHTRSPYSSVLLFVFFHSFQFYERVRGILRDSFFSGLQYKYTTRYNRRNKGQNTI